MECHNQGVVPLRRRSRPSLPLCVSSPVESAHLVLKLYELRRDPVMRVARDWFFRKFNPSSIEDILAVLNGSHNPHYRMVIGYWDMAAALVAHGAIAPAIFRDTNQEVMSVYAKIQPFLEELRTLTRAPDYLRNLERVIGDMPGSEERLAVLREQFRAFAAKSEP